MDRRVAVVAVAGRERESDGVATELERAVRQYRAKAGTLVALDPNTGEVLAMATVPRFDPNAVSGATADQWRNRAITDCYEPGSTFKSFLAAAALDAGVVRPTDTIHCENGSWTVAKRVIRDSHPHGVLSFADVIAQSVWHQCEGLATAYGITIPDLPRSRLTGPLTTTG